MDEAMAIARKFAAKYPPALWAIKTLMNETEAEVQDLLEITNRMRKLGNRNFMANDPNKKEMTMAFNEKRKPVYDMGGLVAQQQKIKAYREEHPHFELEI